MTDNQEQKNNSQELNYLLKNVPILDMEDENFIGNLSFAIWSSDSSSDYRNDRERPYNGQPHTSDGKRGEQLVSGVTMRDLKDCLIKAMIESSPPKNETTLDDVIKCWDYSETEEGKPTQFLIEHQNEIDYISSKVEMGTWREQDVYNLNWDDIDPIAITQNFACQVEKMMGIFPNIPELRHK